MMTSTILLLRTQAPQWIQSARRKIDQLRQRWSDRDLGLITQSPDLETIDAQLSMGIIPGMYNPADILFSTSGKSKLISHQTL